MSRSIRDWFVEILKLVLFRRFRNLPMLVLLVLLTAMMAGKFMRSMGAPFLFWHDLLAVRALGLIGVGIFLEEWVYVALLLDNDEDNPAKRSPSAFRTRDEKPKPGLLPRTKFVDDTRQILNQNSGVEAKGDESKEVFGHTRRLHTIATFTLCICLSVGSCAWFSFHDHGSTLNNMAFVGNLLCAAYFPLVGAFMAFIVRKLLQNAFDKNLIPRWLKTNRLIRFAYEYAIGDRTLRFLVTDDEKEASDRDSDSIGSEFRRFHQIAILKNLIFAAVVLMFCVAYWNSDHDEIEVPIFASLGMFVTYLVGLAVFVRSRWNSRVLNFEFWFATITLVALPTLLLWTLWSSDPWYENLVSSVAFIAAILLTIVVGLYGWFVFQSRRIWFELIVISMVSTGLVYFGRMQKVAQVIDMRPRQLSQAVDTPEHGGLRTLSPLDLELKRVEDCVAEQSDKPSLVSWKQRFSERGVQLPVLVVIQNSGGGIKAQVWSSIVLSALEQTINQELKRRGEITNDSFHSHVRLVTGTSGGMVGAAYWVATLEDKKEGTNFHFERDAQGTSQPISAESYIDNMSKDALDDVARQMFYNDVIAAGYNFVFSNSRLHSRGIALERALEKHGPAFKNALNQLIAGENAGWRPTLAFAPTVVEDGRRLLICNQPIEYTLVSDLPWVTSGKTKKSIAGYSWRLSFPNSNLRISEAARLNANFPVFVNSPRLSFWRHGTPDMRVMDAGYIDNYGGVIATQWLWHNADWLKNNTSGVLLVQIVASHLERNDSLATKTTKLPEIGGFVTSSFNKTMHHVDMSAANLASKLNNGDESNDFFRIVSFDYEGDASLTWHLSNREKMSLIYPFVATDTLAKFSESVEPHNTELEFDRLFSEDGLIYRNVIQHECSGFLDRLATAHDDARNGKERIDHASIRLLRSRESIHKQLSSVKDWWFGRGRSASSR